MSLEKLFVDRDVLDRDQSPPLVVLEDAVDEQRGIPVAESVEEDRDIGGVHCRDEGIGPRDYSTPER